MIAGVHAVSLTTDSSGAATGYTPTFTGRIHSIRYLKSTFDNGVDFTITLDGTGEAILTLTDQNASAQWYPRVQVHDAVGVGATLDGTRLMRDMVLSVADRVKIVIAQGGNTKAGTVYVYYY